MASSASTIPCPKCGESLALNRETGMFRCANCNFKRPETLDEAAARIRQRGQRPVVTITYRGKLDERARALFDNGHAYLWNENKTAALDAFQDAVDLQRDFADAHLWIAKISDDERVQRDHLSEIIAHDPGHLEALRMLMVLNGQMTPEEAELSREERAPVMMNAEGKVGATTTTLLCPVCGGRLTIDEVSGQVICNFCGYNAPLDANRHASDGAQILGAALLKRRVQPVKWIVGDRILHCTQCGAERTIPAARLSTTCPFCGSTQVIQQDALNSIEQPNGLLPFTVTEAEAQNAVRERLKGVSERFAGLFDDNRIARASMEGIYLPYWVFDVLAEVSKTVIDRRTSSSRYERAPIRPYENVKFSEGSLSICIPAVKSPAPALTADVGDFDVSAAVAYEPKLLAKYPAELYAIDFDEASLTAQSVVSEQMRQRYGKRETQNTEVMIFTSVLQMSFTLLLMPVWVVTLYERDGDVRVALVNGQSGRVALGKAQKPS